MFVSNLSSEAANSCINCFRNKHINGRNTKTLSPTFEKGAVTVSCRSAGRRCPHCQCERWQRHGHANDLQRCRCYPCRRTFNGQAMMPPPAAPRWLPNCLG